jgi:hypothetical protein
VEGLVRAEGVVGVSEEVDFDDQRIAVAAGGAVEVLATLGCVSPWRVCADAQERGSA